MQIALAARFCLCLLVFVGFSSAVFADPTHERTQFGHDITVGPGEEADEVTCFGCSVHVRGHVTGDLTAFGGTVSLEDSAQVDGDVTVFAGTVRLDGPVKINGDLSVFGGRIRRDPSSTIGGDVTNFGGRFWIVLILGMPLIVLGGFIALLVWLVRIITRRRIPAAA